VGYPPTSCAPTWTPPGWSHTTLALHIKNRLQQRQGGAVSHFQARLPAPDSALAHDTLKIPCLFDFLGLGDEAQEQMTIPSPLRPRPAGSSYRPGAGVSGTTGSGEWSGL